MSGKYLFERMCTTIEKFETKTNNNIYFVCRSVKLTNHLAAPFGSCAVDAFYGNDDYLDDLLDGGYFTSVRQLKVFMKQFRSL